MYTHHHVDTHALASDDIQFSSFYPFSTLHQLVLTVLALYGSPQEMLPFRNQIQYHPSASNRIMNVKRTIGNQLECTEENIYKSSVSGTNKQNRTIDKVTSSCQVAGLEDIHIAPYKSLFLWNTYRREKSELDFHLSKIMHTRICWKGWSTRRRFSLEITQQPQFHLQSIDSFTVLTKIVIKMHISNNNNGYLLVLNK